MQFPVSAFLGTYTPPEQLTLQAVQATAAPETFESAIAAAQLLAPGVLAAVRDAAQSLKPGEQLGVGAWSQDVSVLVAGRRGAPSLCVAGCPEMQAGSTSGSGSYITGPLV